MVDPYFPIAPALPKAPPPKYRNIAVIYRNLGNDIPQGNIIEINKDRWYFVRLSQSGYMMGTTFDLIMLFDGITQHEFIHDAGYTAFFPMIKKDCVILEAG